MSHLAKHLALTHAPPWRVPNGPPPALARWARPGRAATRASRLARMRTSHGVLARPGAEVALYVAAQRRGADVLPPIAPRWGRQRWGTCTTCPSGRAPKRTNTLHAARWGCAATGIRRWRLSACRSSPPPAGRTAWRGIRPRGCPLVSCSSHYHTPDHTLAGKPLDTTPPRSSPRWPLHPRPRRSAVISRHFSAARLGMADLDGVGYGGASRRYADARISSPSDRHAPSIAGERQAPPSGPGLPRTTRTSRLRIPLARRAAPRA